jgi:hypothetical protein
MLCSCKLGSRFLRLALPDEAGYCKGGYGLSARGAQQQQTAENGGREKTREIAQAAHESTIAGFFAPCNRLGLMLQ